MLRPRASFGTDDSKHSDASVRVIRAEASKQKFGCPSELYSFTATVCEFAFEQIVFVGPCCKPRTLPRACEQRTVEILHSAG
jgi:hypothetical protein